MTCCPGSELIVQMVFALSPVVAPASEGIPVRVIAAPAGLVTGRPTMSGPVTVPLLARSLPPLLYDTIELLIANVPPAWLLMPAPADGVGDVPDPLAIEFSSMVESTKVAVPALSIAPPNLPPPGPPTTELA